MEKLSVVVPVYNVYPYLRECLDSIINQTYKNLEIIIVNDASPYKEDDEICKEYAAKDERIKYIVHGKNKGLGGARNTGIDSATGKYVTFVDSDDYLCDKNIYKYVIEYLTSDINVVGFGIKYYKENEKEYGQFDWMKREKEINTMPQVMDIIKVSDVVWNKVYKLEDIINKDIRFREHFIHEDTDFTIRYIELVEPRYLYVDIIGYIYRQREGSIISSISNIDIRCGSLMTIYEWLIENKRDKKYEEYFFNMMNGYIYNDNLVEKPESLIKLYNTLLDRMDINKINLDYFINFINNEKVKKIYTKKIEIYKKFKYKAVAPNIYVYKIKREIKRIIKQIKGIFIKDK